MNAYLLTYKASLLVTNLSRGQPSAAKKRNNACFVICETTPKSCVRRRCNGAWAGLSYSSRARAPAPHGPAQLRFHSFVRFRNELRFHAHYVRETEVSRSSMEVIPDEDHLDWRVAFELCSCGSRRTTTPSPGRRCVIAIVFR